MGKLFVLLDLFRKGNAVANVEAWKHGGAGLQAVLVAFIVCVASTGRAFGYDLPITAEAANSIAGGIIALVGVFFTYLTSDKVGLPAKPAAPVAGPAGDPPAGGQGPLAAPVGSGPAERAAPPVRVEPAAPPAFDPHVQG